jgi:hypothetical protein
MHCAGRKYIHPNWEVNHSLIDNTVTLFIPTSLDSCLRKGLYSLANSSQYYPIKGMRNLKKDQTADCVSSLIRSGVALPFTAHASSPTVTMPRLKAMTTGSVPSFLDVILNIAESDTSSTLAFQDTWLAQLKARGDQLVMYGDDTWLKLFPGMFGRADGTTSFFVSVSDLRSWRAISSDSIRE